MKRHISRGYTMFPKDNFNIIIDNKRFGQDIDRLHHYERQIDDVAMSFLLLNKRARILCIICSAVPERRALFVGINSA